MAKESTKPLSKAIPRARADAHKAGSGLTWQRMLPYAFIFPAFVFYSVFLAIPIVGTVIISLFEWTGISFNTIKWVGFDNYAALTRDDVFWQAIKHNVYFIAGGMTSIVVVGLFLAVLLEQNLPGSSFFRGIFFVPTVMSLVVVGLVFTLILSPELGLVNPLLRQLGLGHLAKAWLGDPQTALPTVIAVDVWRNFGLGMFLFIAGLKGIDSEIFEAAKIDGATPWQSFWRITMPLLWPVTALVIILTSINTLKLFDLIYVMTAGGPNHASQVLTTWMYSQGFTYNKMGYGSALAVVLLVLTFVFTLVQLRVFSRDTRAGGAQ
jgi:raffinose/stachyose/melibiose transport system permease protein